MENANSYEYLEKIKIAVIENLKRTAPVPSVQMQDVPRQGLGMSDEEEAELDDMDADENKDVRMTQRQWEKSTARQEDQFYESDDEEMATANGVYKTNGKKRPSILDHPNPHADIEMDSGLMTPVKNGDGAAADKNDAADDTMVDETTIEPNEVDKPDTSATNVNEDGDIDMVDAGEPAADAPVKNEEVDGQPMLPAEEKRAPSAEPTAAAGEAGKDASDTKVETGETATEKPALESDRMETGSAPATDEKKTGSQNGDDSASLPKA